MSASYDVGGEEETAGSIEITGPGSYTIPISSPSGRPDSVIIRIGSPALAINTVKTGSAEGTIVTGTGAVQGGIYIWTSNTTPDQSTSLYVVVTEAY